MGEGTPADRAGAGAPAGRQDVIVAGLGVMGAAATAELARRGVRVLGLDRYRPPHARGSSHGETRMIREAYYEDPVYVPLVQRAWQGWRSLERQTGASLLFRTGGLMVGPREGELLRGVRASARSHGLSVEALSGDDLGRRFPVFRVPPDHAAILEERAGYLRAEPCLEAFHRVAREGGATLRFGEAVVGWTVEAGAVRVETAEGSYRASRLVLAVGPWLPELLGELAVPLRVERQVQLWFAPRAATAPSFRPDRFPVFLWEHEPGKFWYGFPEVARAVKVAQHHGGVECSPSDLDRTVGGGDVRPVRQLLRAGLPGADGELLRGEVCLYTDTPDGHFLLDHHPESPAVVIMSPCSGHGFKFAPVLGEMAADLALEGGSELRPPAFAFRDRG